MTKKKTGPRPGDVLLNHYLPDADEETRERAREAFARYGTLLMLVIERMASEPVPTGLDSGDEDKTRTGA